ncbi:putative RNA helicase [Perkinsus chesapeaki]|uniref:Putative RNA helicase n=1 Tax=Perkinsus chesapeaki TaxID=330153 RepID=A0A7J6LXH5_PERCH|nr:putative RNA helicase [Perkinsus chesapeaki]
MPSKSLRHLGLSQWAVDVCSSLEITKPTLIQQLAIPAILEGKNVVGASKTGSGKTAAFALPILQKLSKDPFGVFAVILTPVRELAVQIAEQFEALSKPIDGQIACIVGGTSILPQINEIHDRPHIVVATPGRLAEILNGDSSLVEAFAHTEFLVLDEADRLLVSGSGFETSIADIMKALPGKAKRQTLLFTATLSENVMALQQRYGEESMPLLDANPSSDLPTNLRLRYVFIPAMVRMAYLNYLVCQKFSEDNMIIFTATLRSCQLVASTLEKLGVSVAALHSLQDQRRRTASLGKFRNAKVRVLVATDVASRGLDIPQVGVVLNYELPTDPDDFVHRAGRTARAGRKGDAVSIVTEGDVQLVKSVEERMGVTMEKLEIEDEDATILKLLTKTSKAVQEAELMLFEVGFDEKIKESKRRKRKYREMAAQRRPANNTGEEHYWVSSFIMSVLGRFFGYSSGQGQSLDSVKEERGERHSLSQMAEIYKRITARLKEPEALSGSSCEGLVEDLREISEILLWGEQNDHQELFDYFCEKEMLSSFVSAVGAPCDWSSDEELLSYYITFVKSLALRLDQEMLTLFFHNDQFVLYTVPIRLYNSSDAMVRTSVRTLTLAIYQVADRSCMDFLVTHSGGYFSLLSQGLREQWQKVGKLSTSRRVAEAAVDDIVDVLLYISDIFTVDNPNIQPLLNLLVDKMSMYALEPILAPRQEAPNKILATFVMVQISHYLNAPEIRTKLAEFSPAPPSLPNPDEADESISVLDAARLLESFPNDLPKVSSGGRKFPKPELAESCLDLVKSGYEKQWNLLTIELLLALYKAVIGHAEKGPSDRAWECFHAVASEARKHVFDAPRGMLYKDAIEKADSELKQTTSASKSSKKLTNAAGVLSSVSSL